MKHEFINLHRFLGSPYNFGGGRKKQEIKVFNVKFRCVIGLGYWKCVYPEPFSGHLHNVVLPFLVIQKGTITV